MSNSSALEGLGVEDLFDAVLSLNDREECYRLFEDLCTISEIKALAQRIEVAQMLSQNATYHEISHKTGASTATISRVNRCLNYGAGGYSMVIDRISKEK